MDTAKVKLREKQKQVAGPSWTLQSKLHSDKRREIENCVDARRGKEPSKVMAARYISSAGESKRKKEKTEEAGAESWHPQTGSREGATTSQSPGPTWRPKRRNDI
ncbi:hypothetical protein VE04_00442 [Pseudogymnoascus sp. 24MN13]|nr:hypothetical protein VE04_00442 [Pseudogymnoascus sp. 24MN13]